MNHLFLDLAKVPTKPRNIPFEQARVALFVRPKAAKHLTCPEEPHGIYVLPKENAAQSIVQAAYEILSHHPEARLVFVSPRKKIAALLPEVQAAFPRATLLHKNKLGKKVRQFLQNHDESRTDESSLEQMRHSLRAEQTLNVDEMSIPEVKHVAESSNDKIKAATQNHSSASSTTPKTHKPQVMPSKTLAMTKLAQLINTDTEADIFIQDHSENMLDIANLSEEELSTIRQLRPKTKSDLIRHIMQTFNVSHTRANYVVMQMQLTNLIQINGKQQVYYNKNAEHDIIQKAKNQ